jgi:hypothetical protein
VAPGSGGLPAPLGIALAILRGVSHRTVESLLGRLATDASLRRRFAADPYGLLVRLQADGHELTGLEVEALATTDASALQTLADAIDRRLRKADIEVDPDRG